MRKLRFAALILICLGLLIGGLGLGMCFVEASSFTYGEGSRLNMTVTDTATRQFLLEEGETITGYEFWNMPIASGAEVPQVETDAHLAPGMVQVDVAYRAVPGCTLDLWVSHYSDGIVTVHASPNAGVEAVLEAKDQLLSDIQNRRIGDYQWAEITGITFTVNPADRDRVDIG